jgi:hypothetical protein
VTPPAGGPDAETTGPVGDSDDSQKWFAQHRAFTAKNPTGAFDNVLASFRFTPRPYRWREILLSVGVLYGLFVGLPVGAGIWAAVEIWHRVRG